MDLQLSPAAPPVTSHPMPPGAGVAVETLLLGVHHGRLTYRATRQPLGDDEHPDTLAGRLAGFANGPDDGRLLHSTSWRFAAGTIVLTYAALPDPDPATATVLGAAAAPARGSGPLTPTPEHIDHTDVVAHACRHLAFLLRTDPVVAATRTAGDDLWDLLERHHPDVAGQH